MSVIDITAKLNERASEYGADSFVLCPCQQDEREPVGFFPCVSHDASGAFIYAMVCMACQDACYVENGRLGEWESDQ